MNILIRQTDGPDSREAVYADRVVDAPHLKCGASPDCELQIIVDSVALLHFTIARSGGNLKLDSRKNSVVVNGEASNGGRLSFGDVIEIAGHRIEIISPPAGVELALQVSCEKQLPGRVERLYRTSLDKTGLSPRLFAWGLSIAVLAFGLLFPLMHYFGNSPDQESGMAATPAANSSPMSWLASDRLWSSGPLHRAHTSLEENCSACHQKLFQKVTDAACLDCHTGIADHIEVPAKPQPDGHSFENGRCASCHREHNEPYTTLIIQKDSVCTSCHAGSEIVAADNRVYSKAASFAFDEHPAFQPELLSPTNGATLESNNSSPDEVNWERVRSTGDDVRENSQLIFDHKVHLFNPESGTLRVDPDSGSEIGCANCHRLNNDGEHFAEMSFEKTCADCHELNLDPNNRIPHGVPEAVVNTIKGYYLQSVGDSTAQANSTIDDCRRRPGKDNCAPRCVGSPYECAMQLAEFSIKEKYFNFSGENNTGCAQCHIAIEQNSTIDVGGSVEIAAVRINGDYYPHSQFDHQSHSAMVNPEGLESFTGDNACEFCHNATQSSESSDVLIPGIKNCLTCHGPDVPSGGVAVGCIGCHNLHQRDGID